ncbi:hypothetical protein C2W64_03559 [Brevibacillus laterosporus]|nr:hypothetical protein C2W64_03559 [Brevibacillus laterosporus]
MKVNNPHLHHLLNLDGELYVVDGYKLHVHFKKLVQSF